METLIECDDSHKPAFLETIFIAGFFNEDALQWVHSRAPAE